MSHPIPLVLDAKQRCPYCFDGLRVGERLLACADCSSVYYAECSDEGRCPTLGCPNGRPIPAAAPPPRPPSRTGTVVAIALALASLVGVAAIALKTRIQPVPCEPAPSVPVPGVPAPPPAPRVVFVQAPAPTRNPEPYWRGTPPVVALELPSETEGREVVLEGNLGGPAPLQVSVEAPGGQFVRWDGQEAGPFAAAITLPGPGLHEVTVRVVDADGLTRERRYQVCATR